MREKPAPDVVFFPCQTRDMGRNEQQDGLMVGTVASQGEEDPGLEPWIGLGA